ncbi:MAG: thiamine pyrophosphate-dependent enzyme [Bacillota bacterium]|nr:thiamine pyrophosphate-dependent enzyme [Bacillota bacterium]
MNSNWQEDVKQMASGIRLRVLKHTIDSNGGYLSQACSSAELFSVLYKRILKLDKLEKPLLPEKFQGVPNSERKAVTGINFNGGGKQENDNFILSPAQYALVLYAALIEAGRMDEKAMEEYNKDGSSVEMIGAEHSPGMEVTTGSLGQGISQAAGIAYARKVRGDSGRVVVFLSDGECQSGEFWEAVQAMSFLKLNNMLMFIDVNGFQCDGETKDVMNIEPFDERIRAFGARVFRINGHDIEKIAELGELAPADVPTFVLCDTNPHKDMEILKERYPKYHYTRFSSDEERERYQEHYDELLEARRG